MGDEWKVGDRNIPGPLGQIEQVLKDEKEYKAESPQGDSMIVTTRGDQTPGEAIAEGQVRPAE
jgi:hypothetical protein